MDNNFDNGSSNRELVLELLQAFNAFKQKLEDPNYIQLEMAIKQMMENQREMKDDITELKKQLLNPYDGVIVETQKNSDHRREVVALEAERLKMIEEHKSLLRWKSNIQKFGIAILTSAGAIVTWAISEFVFKK